MTLSDARELLGLTEGLVTDLQTWGWEDDSTVLRGGWDAWLARGVELQRRLRAELEPGLDVEFKPE